jgi:hypothetical protein
MAINNTQAAIKAYEKQKTPSNGPDPKDHEEIVRTVKIVKTEIIIEEKKDV